MASETEETVETYQSGLTWRSFLGLLYCSIVLMPAAIFAFLVTGMGIAAAGFPVIGFVAVFLAAEVARLAGAKLTQQELFMIWSHSMLAVGSWLALDFIQAIYFRDICPVTWAFVKEGKPLPLVIPDWYAPPPGSEVLRLRTLFHPDFIMPIIVTLIFSIIAWVILPVIKGFLLYQLFAVGERLPFPIQQVQAETCITLSVRETRRYDILMVASLISAAYAFVAYFLPFALGFPTIIPIPWVDLTTSIERSLPGAAIGIGTSLVSVAIGMMLPFPVVINMLVGSIAVWLIGNPMLVQYGILEHRVGMNIALILQESTLKFWAFAQIGLFVAAAVVPLALKSRAFAAAIKGIVKISGAEKKMGLISLKYLILLFFAVSTALLGVFLWLTDFPWYLLALLTYGWAFVTPMIMVRAIGETGMSISVPYVNETVILMSGYPKADIWFTPLRFLGFGGTGIATSFKVCELTKTTISSWIKMLFIITPIAWALSFIYAELFWKIAPIPSAIYPATNIQWPVTVIQNSLWITGAYAMGGYQILIAYSFVIGAVIAVVGNFLPLPISIISLAVGTSTPIPNMITVTVGAVISRVFIRILGAETWRKDRTTVVAGIFLGQSITLALAVGGAMLARSLWPLPF